MSWTECDRWKQAESDEEEISSSLRELATGEKARADSWIRATGTL